MQAWILEERKWGEVGTRRFVAEWYVPRPGVDPDDEDIDPSDQFLTKRATRKTMVAALAKARAVRDAGESYFGGIEVYEEVLDDEFGDGVGEWKIVGRTVEVQ